MPNTPLAVSREIAAYRLDERRTDRYTFTNLKALVKYFTAWVPKELVMEKVEEAKHGFVPRAGASEEETRLQFLKKCEYTLVRLLRSGAVSMA